jgi:hypothetical protein
MVEDGSSIDLEALWRVTASCGIDVLLGMWNVKKTTQAVTQDWWHPSG